MKGGFLTGHSPFSIGGERLGRVERGGGGGRRRQGGGGKMAWDRGRRGGVDLFYDWFGQGIKNG